MITDAGGELRDAHITPRPLVTKALGTLALDQNAMYECFFDLQTTI